MEWAVKYLLYYPALLPVHWLLIVGLAEGTDHIARFFGAWLLTTLGSKMSYGVCILQSPVHQLLCLAGAMGTERITNAVSTAAKDI